MIKFERTLLMLTFASFSVFFLSLIGAIVFVIRIIVYHDHLYFFPFIVMLTSFAFLVILNSIININERLNEKNEEIATLTTKINEIENKIGMK